MVRNFPAYTGSDNRLTNSGKWSSDTKGICCLQEFEFGGIRCENGTKRADLFGAKAFDFEYLIRDLDSVVILIGIEHPNPQFVNIVVGGKDVAIGINEWQI